MADIIYKYKETPYFNITNKCPCSCVFCIRDKKDVIGEAKKMWHDTQPTFEDVKKAIDSFDWSGAECAVFCGYGEPTNELELLRDRNILYSMMKELRCWPQNSSFHYTNQNHRFLENYRCGQIIIIF